MDRYDYLDRIGFVGTGKHDPRMDRVVSEAIREYKAKQKKSSNTQRDTIKDKAL